MILVYRRQLRDATDPFGILKQHFRDLYRLSRYAAFVLFKELSLYMTKRIKKNNYSAIYPEVSDILECKWLSRFRFDQFTNTMLLSLCQVVYIKNYVCTFTLFDHLPYFQIL